MYRARFTGLATLAALLGAASGAVAAERVDFANLAKSRYVHCAFYKAYETDPATGDPIMVEGKADSLVHFQDVDAGRARAKAIYTRMSGSHEVKVIQTDKALHFIENVAGMYIMTTVHSCLEYDEKRGACVMYGAVNARLFDTAVLNAPDKVYEKIKDNADPGFCDYSFIGIQEATNGKQ
jgi:hypothetical protein